MSIIVGGNTISSSSSVKNLGVYMDSALTMEKQVNAVTKSCYYQIRNIGHIRHYISNEACKFLVHSLVTSSLDYGNAVLYGIPQTLSGRLQRVQNCAARLITRTRKREHITPVLCQLHWLTVRYRSHYQILLYTYKAINGSAPVYLTDLVTKHEPRRSLRSQSKSMLTVPHTRTSLMEIDAFVNQQPCCGINCQNM